MENEHKYLNEVTFEVIDTLSDDNRFAKVKVWIAHVGKNLNKSVFSRDALIKMSATLPYIPIVGYIEKDSYDDFDFSNHKISIVLDNEGIKTEYLGHAYGFVPENPNVNMEFRDGKEWLTCEAYLWTKFEKSIEIMNESEGSKGHSMEIQDIDGSIDKNRDFNVINGNFSALCILGEGVQPAMNGSTIEYFSTKVDFKKQIEELFSNFSMKGEQTLNEEKTVLETEIVEEEVVETNETEEATEELTVDFTEEDSKDVIETEEDPEDTLKDETEEESVEDVQTEVAKDFAIIEEKYGKYALSFEEVRKNIYMMLENVLDSENEWAYVFETYEKHFLFKLEQYNTESGEWSTKTFSCNYENTENGLIIDFSNRTEMYPMYLTADEKTQVEDNREAVKALEAELESLKTRLNSYDSEAKQSIITEYSEGLSEENISLLKEKLDNHSVEEFEKEVAFMFAKNSKSNKKDKRNNLAGATYSLFSVDSTDKNDELSEANYLFK